MVKARLLYLEGPTIRVPLSTSAFVIPLLTCKNSSTWQRPTAKLSTAQYASISQCNHLSLNLPVPQSQSYPPPPSSPGYPSQQSYPPPPSQNSPSNPGGYPPPPPFQQQYSDTGHQASYQSALQSPPIQPQQNYLPDKSSNTYNEPPPSGGYVGHSQVPVDPEKEKPLNTDQSSQMSGGAPTAAHFTGVSATQDDIGTFNGGSYRISHRDSNTILTVQLARGCPMQAKPGTCPWKIARIDQEVANECIQAS